MNATTTMATCSTKADNHDGSNKPAMMLTTCHTSAMALKGSRATTGKTRKIPQINECNYDHDSFEMALYSAQNRRYLQPNCHNRKLQHEHTTRNNNSRSSISFPAQRKEYGKIKHSITATISGKSIDGGLRFFSQIFRQSLSGSLLAPACQNDKALDSLLKAVSLANYLQLYSNHALAQNVGFLKSQRFCLNNPQSWQKQQASNTFRKFSHIPAAPKGITRDFLRESGLSRTLTTQTKLSTFFFG